MSRETKKTVQQEWDHIIDTLKRRLLDYVDSIGIKIPANLYKVEMSGSLNEGYDVAPYYSYPFATWPTNSKRVTKKDIERINANIGSFQGFSKEKLSFEYKYKWNPEYGPASTGISLKDFEAMRPPYFIDKSLAEAYSNQIKEQRRIDKEFDELHKKDASYDYTRNGYKFLGWQNSWKHVYFDENGKETDDPAKRRTFGYRTQDYPEYGNCRDQKHRTIEVSHDNRGSEHSVSCPICKIMWKYDSSD